MRFTKQTIYRIVNTVNGKCYIGRSTDPKRRFTEHKIMPPPSKMAKQDFYLYRNFLKLEYLEEFLPIDEAKEAEMYWILYYRSYEPEHGYNTNIGSRSSRFADELRKEFGLK